MVDNKYRITIRISLLIGLMITLLLLAKFTSLGYYFDLENLQELILSFGSWGVLIFFLFFLSGTIMSIPGAVFLVFAVLTYGYFWGIILSFACAQICCMINFYFARFIGGKSLSEINNKYVKKLLVRVDEKPILTVFWLRIFVLLNPVVNYAMALTNVSATKFFIANLIAMIFPFGFIISVTFFIRSEFFQQVILTWFKNIF